MNSRAHTLLLITLLLTPATAPAKAIRLNDLNEANQKMNQGELDFTMVLFHGSDWCISGERIKQNAWDPDELPASLPSRVGLVSIDIVDDAQPWPELDPSFGAAHSALDPQTPQRVTSRDGSRYTLLDTGYWLADPEGPNPHHEQTTIHFRLNQPASMLRLIAATHPSMPQQGPGRAHNGHFKLNECLLHQGETPIPIRGGMASYDSKHGRASEAFDGSLDPRNGWSVDVRNQTHILYFATEEPLPANQDLTLTLVHQPPWGQHHFGHFKLDVSHHPEYTTRLIRAADSIKSKQQIEQLKLNPNNFPAAFVLIKDLKPWLRREGLPADTSTADLAAITRNAYELHDQHASLRKQWQTATQENKLDALGTWFLFLEENNLRHVGPDFNARLAELDPDKQSPWTHRIRNDFDWLKTEADNLAKAGKQQQACELIDTWLADPRFAQLTPGQRQEILLKKFRIVRAWEGHEEQRFDIAREIYKTEPTTFLGRGARGYREMHQRGEANILHGWLPRHIQPGSHQLNITSGIPLHFHKPGNYNIVFKTQSADQALQLHAVALLDGDQVVAEHQQETSLGPQSEPARYQLQLPEGHAPENLTLRISYTAPEGHNHRSQRITVSPILPPDGEFGYR